MCNLDTEAFKQKNARGDWSWKGGCLSEVPTNAEAPITGEFCLPLQAISLHPKLQEVKSA